MTPRRAALVGIVFLLIAGFYYAFPYLVDPSVIDYAGITMLIALGVAMSLMAYVLVAGTRQMIEQLWSDLIEFTSQFVIPDWGALISLLPVFLAIPVFGYITWTIYRWATAGPTRSGKRRLPPA